MCKIDGNFASTYVDALKLAFWCSNCKIKFLGVYYTPKYHGCQNPDLDPTILRFYDSTYPKRSKSFKDLCDHSRLVELYDSNNPKQPWFLVIFFNLTEGIVGAKWKIKS